MAKTKNAEAKAKDTDQTLATDPPGGKHHATTVRDEDRLPSEIGRSDKHRGRKEAVSTETVAKSEK